jgi:hypothetical protein
MSVSLSKLEGTFRAWSESLQHFSYNVLIDLMKSPIIELATYNKV